MTGVTWKLNSIITAEWHDCDISNDFINSAFFPQLQSKKSYKTCVFSVTACSDTDIQALHESYLTFQKVTVYHSAQNTLSIFLLFECLYSRRGSCLAVIRCTALDLWLTEVVFTWKQVLVSSGRRQHNTNMNICWATGHHGDPALSTKG